MLFKINVIGKGEKIKNMEGEKKGNKKPSKTEVDLTSKELKLS